MRWTPGQRSSNLEDRRGQSAGSGGGGAGALGLIFRMLGTKWGLVAVVALFGANWLSGGKLMQAFGGGGGTSQGASSQAQDTSHRGSAEEEELVDFISFALDDAQAV